MTAVLAHAGGRLVDGLASARQRIHDALTIERGTYPMSRDYGSQLDDLVDRRMDAGAIAAVYAAVADAFEHLPNGLEDCRLREVRLENDGTDDARWMVVIYAEWLDATPGPGLLETRIALAAIRHPWYILLARGVPLLLATGTPLQGDAAPEAS